MGAIGLKAKLARLGAVMPGGAVTTDPLPSKRSDAGRSAVHSSPSVNDQGRLAIGAPETSRPDVSALRAMLEALAARQARRVAAERAESEPWATAGETVAAARASAAWARSPSCDGLRILRYALEPDHHHGRVALTSGLRADPEALAELALDPVVATVDPSRVLFLDTETTGLSLGGGTVPFLVGLAYAEEGAIIVEQLFLESLAAEPALLQHLRARVEAASALVTYNGKAYDWPLLMARFVLNRVPPPLARPHLDLLSLARRVYRARLGSVRLVQMEIEVLGHRRERDIDGAEIPGTYWAYQRHGRSAAVLPILEHNIQDLLALAALQGELSARYRTLRIEDDPTDQWARARVAFRARAFDRALSFAEAALDGGAAPRVVGRAALLAADVHRKSGRYADAAQRLEDSLVDLAPGSLEMAQVRLALAKLWEHRLKDPVRALYHAQATALAEGETSSDRRQSRLQKRIARRRLESSASATASSQRARGVNTRDSA